MMVNGHIGDDCEVGDGDVGDIGDVGDVGDVGDNGDVGDDDKFLNANAEDGLAGHCAKHLSYSPATHIVW